MAVEFTVIEADLTRLFRCQLTKVSVDLHRDCGLRDLYFRGIFDNFRTFYSKKDNDPQLPSWEDFDLTWVYETNFANMLGAKLFVFTLMGVDPSTGQKDAFVGEANIDLLTLATGPKDVTLKLHDGDVCVGRVWFTLSMLEVEEMIIVLEELTVRNMPSKYNSAAEEVRCRSEKRSTGRSRMTGYPTKVGPGFITFRDVPHHSTGTSVADLLESEGLDFELFVTGMCHETVIGKASLQYSDYLESALKVPATDENALPDQDMGSEADQRRAAVSTAEINANAADGVSTKKYNYVFDFSVPLNDFDGTPTEGKLEGHCILKNVPVYVQMYAGRTVDGVVVGGKQYPGEHPMPPFVHGGEVRRAVVI